jgi:hypothetical protein
LEKPRPQDALDSLLRTEFLTDSRVYRPAGLIINILSREQVDDWRCLEHDSGSPSLWRGGVERDGGSGTTG